MEVNLKNKLGAFGEVYICYHRATEHARAVKILPKVTMNDAEKRRFLKEMSALRIMDHPNIVRLYETYNDDKRYYLVTEYIIHVTLDSALVVKYSTDLQGRRFCQRGMQCI